MRRHKRTDKNETCGPNAIASSARTNEHKNVVDTRSKETANNTERTDHKGAEKNRRENRMSLQKIINHNSTHSIVFITFARSLFRIVAFSIVLSLAFSPTSHIRWVGFRWNCNTLRQRIVAPFDFDSTRKHRWKTRQIHSTHECLRSVCNVFPSSQPVKV